MSNKQVQQFITQMNNATPDTYIVPYSPEMKAIVGSCPFEELEKKFKKLEADGLCKPWGDY